MTTSLPLAFLIGDESPLELFKHGGVVMWPILILAFVALTVIVERLLFIFAENARHEPEVVEKMLESVEKGDTEGAIQVGSKSRDSVARILV